MAEFDFDSQQPQQPAEHNFDEPAAPAPTPTVKLNQVEHNFDEAPAAPKAPEPPKPGIDLVSSAYAAMDKAVEKGREYVSDDAMKQKASDLLEGGKSAIGKGFKYLDKPRGFIAGLAISAMDEQAQRKLNATNSWAPETSFIDIADYYLDRTVPEAKFMDSMLKAGYSARTAANIYGTMKSAAFVAGMAGDFFMDPLMYIGIGTLTKAAKEARMAGAFVESGEKMGQYVNNSKFLVELKRPSLASPLNPVSTNIGIPLDAVTKPLAPVVEKLGQTAVGQKTAQIARRLYDSFDPLTNIPQVDSEVAYRTSNKAALDQIGKKVMMDIGSDLTPHDSKFIEELMESTPNHAVTGVEGFNPGLSKTVTRTEKVLAQPAYTEINYGKRTVTPPPAPRAPAPEGVVKSKDGSPLVVHHGSPVAFEELDAGRAQPGMTGKGLYVTESFEDAKAYSNKTDRSFYDYDKQEFVENKVKNPSPNVKSYYIKADNPLQVLSDANGGNVRINSNQLWMIEDTARRKLKTMTEGTEAYRDLENLMKHASDVRNGRAPFNGREFLAFDGVSNLVKEAGFDAIKFVEPIEDSIRGKAHTTWMVFDKNQLVRAEPARAAAVNGPALTKTVIERGKEIPAQYKEKIIKDTSVIMGKGRTFGVREEVLQNIVESRAQKIAAKYNLVPERVEQLIERTMQLKKMDSEIVKTGIERGILTSDNWSEFVLRNHLAHVPTERAKLLAQSSRIADQELAIKVQLDALAGEVGKTIDSVGGMSARNPMAKARKVQGTIEEADTVMTKYIKEKLGDQAKDLNSFYVRNPVVATTMRWVEAKKLAENEALIQTLNKFGRKPETMLERDALERMGWGELKVAQLVPGRGKFDPKVVQGQFTKALVERKGGGMLYPPNITDKLGHYLGGREVSAFTSWIDSYNAVFKRAVLSTPGYWVQNWFDDLFKLYAKGTKISSLVEGLKISMDWKGVTKIGGKEYTYDQLRKMTAGIVDTALFAERDVDDLLALGRKWYQNAGGSIDKNVVATMIRGLNQVGSRNQNVLKRAYFVDLLHRGYNAESAIIETERLLFNYKRTTPTMDAFRTFYNPFFQFAAKSAYQLPAMVLQNPAQYNQLMNQFPKVIARAMEEPSDQKFLQEMVPNYVRARDPIVGRLLPGTTFAGVLANLPAPLGGKMPQGQGMAITPSLGPYILDQLNIFDEAVARRNMGFGPAMLNFYRAMTGQDPFTGKTVDPSTINPDTLHRLMNTAWKVGESAIPPFIRQAIENVADIRLKSDPNSRFMPPPVLGLIQTAFPQFVQFPNFEKEFILRASILQVARLEYGRRFKDAVQRDLLGANARLWMSDKPEAIRKAYDISHLTPENLLNAFTDDMSDFVKQARAKQYLEGKRSVKDTLELLQGIDEQMKRLNESFLTTYRTVLLKRKAELQKGGRFETDRAINEGASLMAQKFGLEDKPAEPTLPEDPALGQ